MIHWRHTTSWESKIVRCLKGKKLIKNENARLQSVAIELEHFEGLCNL